MNESNRTSSPAVGIEKKRTEGIFLLLLAATFLCTLLVPLMLTYPKLALFAAWIPLFLGIGVLLITVKKTVTLVLFSVAAFSLLSLSGSPLLPALLFSVVFPSAFLAASLATARGKKLLPALLLLPLSYAAAFAIAADPWVALTAPLLLLPGLILGLFRRMRGELAPALICAALPTVLAIAGFACLLIVNSFGRLDQAAVSQAAFALSDGLTAIFCSIMEEAYAAMGSGENIRQLYFAFSALSGRLVSLLPGLLIAFSLVLAFVVNAVSRRLIPLCGGEPAVDSPTEKLHVSLFAAFFFIASQILGAATSPSGEMSFLALVAQNLSIILLPAMLLLGAETLKLLATKSMGGSFASIAIILACLMISTYYSASILTLLAFVGAAGIMVIRLDRWAKEYYQKGERQ